MPVNPDEILIFKMRGIKAARGEQPLRAEEKAPAPAPVAAPAAAPQPAPAAPQVQAEPKQRRPFFAPKPKQAQKEKAPQLAKEQVLQPGEIPLGVLTEEERKMRELESLEDQARHYETKEGLEREISEARSGRTVTVVSLFSRVSGILFIITALVFGYSIYPQSVFVVNYVIKGGLSSLLAGLNFNYEISLIDTVLVILNAVGGLLMLGGAKKSHVMCSLSGAAMLVMTSFEYLNSGASYTLIVSILAFLSIVSLAYARMSAVTVIEREYPNTPISWPRMETF